MGDLTASELKAEDQIVKAIDFSKPIDSNLRDVAVLSSVTDETYLEKIDYRAIPVKHDEQIKALAEYYPKRYDELVWSLNNIPGLNIPIEKLRIARILDKYACILKEIEFRENAVITRHPIGTTYYIDLDSGSDSNSGTDSGNPWLTLEKFTSVTTRSTTSQDVAKVKAGTSQVATAVIGFDEAGQLNAPHTIQGVDSDWTDWTPGSTRPLIDFNGAAYYFGFSTDYNWKLEHLEAIGTSSVSYAVINASASRGIQVSDCSISSNYANTSSKGLQCNGVSGLIVDSCLFLNNGGISVYHAGGHALYLNCLFNGGSGVSTDYGFQNGAGIAYLKDCQFGQTTAHDTADIYGASYGSQGSPIYLYNVKWNTTPSYPTYGDCAAFYSEHDNGVLNAHKAYLGNFGTISRVTDEVRTGGADTSAKMSPLSLCSTIFPLTLGRTFSLPRMAYWATEDVEKTITMYAKRDSWATFAAGDCYLKAVYLSSESTLDTTTIQSTETVGTDWTALTVTFTPQRTAMVYFDICLTRYESGKSVWIDPLAVIS